MNDGYITTNEWFCAFLMYLFGEECLLRIEIESDGSSQAHGRNHRVKKFTCDVPSFDAKEYHEELKEGRLAISDLNAFASVYMRLNRILRDMTRSGETSYESPSWIAGRG